MISSYSHWQRRRHSPRHVLPVAAFSETAAEAVSTVSVERAWEAVHVADMADNGLARGTPRSDTRIEECNGDQVGK